MTQSPRSIHDPEVRADIRAVLSSLADVVVVIRVAGGAGSRDWFLLQAPDDVEEMLTWAHPVDAVDVFCEPQLPVRGTVDRALRSAVGRLASEADEWDEWFVGCRHDGQVHLGDIFEGWRGDPDSAAEFSHWLDEHEGAQVIAGPHPWGREPGRC